MAGLLDDIDLNDPKTMGLLNIGLGILAGNTGRPGDLGQGVMGGFQNYQQMLAQQQNAALRKQQQEMQATQFDWQKADRERADAQAAARQQALGGVSQQFGIDPNVVAAFPSIGEDLVKSKLIPKSPKIGFTPSGVAYDENSPNLELGKAYAKPEAPKSRTVRIGTQEVTQEYNPTTMQWDEVGRGAAFKTSPDVVTNIGFPKETFKNERDLRNDFQGLPTTKAFREVQTSYDQITTALKNPSAANDLAAATKFMKLLDPGSVVRESELGLAMAATGQLDRMGNYLNLLQTGQKLTPSQRKDFAKSAEQLYGAAAGRYNETADEYQQLAKEYELKPERIAKPAALPEKATATPPRDAVNYLRMNPKLRDQFDAKYGAGAAAQVLGK